MVAASSTSLGTGTGTSTSSTNNPANTAATNTINNKTIPPLIPPPRDVARPVSNLGNTCYMNAVLQALAHAPELCLAMDCEPHHVNCPIAMENRKRRISSSPTSSPEDNSNNAMITENEFRRNNPKQAIAARKLRRSSRKSPTSGQSANSSNTFKDQPLDNKDYSGNSNVNSNSNNDDGPKYCALCEMEWHLQEVHSQAAGVKDKPVAPSFFVHGFIDHVAPWFKLGQQEDSHEFLRLLIDAMQRSCKNARPSEDEDIPPIGDDNATGSCGNGTNDDSKDVEYPFQLFRGTVESCVTCDSCKASSSTLDPIEDVGLEVTTHSTPPALSTRGGSSPGSAEALADVTSAFRRFARVEALDAGYKCENCGKGGRATKQSRLASIPPILTLHLKRFRYGADGRPSPAPTNSRRAKSGSAKIEGHIKFEQIFDIKPYLTDKLQKKHKAMFCRLFAVIVHAGKNSHSGHYIAYVRSIGCNEWWKMDDARVTMASMDEVRNAEAYMLFYRVLEHPFAVKLEEKAKKMRDERDEIIARLDAEAKAEVEKAKAEQVETEKENVPAEDVVMAENKPVVDSPVAAAKAAPVKPTTSPDKIKTEPSAPANATNTNSTATVATTTTTTTTTNNTSTTTTTNKAGGAKNSPPAPAATASATNSRKRGLAVPAYKDGQSWAKANTRLKTSQFSSLRMAEEYINENVQFKPEFFKRLTEESVKPGAKEGHFPIKRITGDDVVGGFNKFSLGLKKTLHRLAQRHEEETSEPFFTLPVSTGTAATEAAAKSNLLEKFVAVGSAGGVDEDLL